MGVREEGMEVEDTDTYGDANGDFYREKNGDSNVETKS